MEVMEKTIKRAWEIVSIIRDSSGFIDNFKLKREFVYNPATGVKMQVTNGDKYVSCYEVVRPYETEIIELYAALRDYCPCGIITIKDHISALSHICEYYHRNVLNEDWCLPYNDTPQYNFHDSDRPIPLPKRIEVPVDCFTRKNQKDE